MSRLLFECSTVFRSPGVNSGIQRVVRNIVRHLPSQTDAECIPVVFANNRLYRVNQLLPGPEDKTPAARLYRQLHRFNHAFWGLHNKYESQLSICRWHNGRRVFFVAWRVLGLPVSALMRGLAMLGYDPLRLRAEPFVSKPGDQLVLLDSSWHEQNFALVENLKRQGVGIVAVIYDLIPVTRPEFFDQRLHDIYNAWFSWVIHQANGFMSISRSVRDELKTELHKRLGQDAAQQCWHGFFHLGSELDLRAEGGGPKPALVDVFTQPQQVYLAVSTIEPRKNHTYLLDAFEQAWAAGSQAHLCIIGRIGWKCAELIDRIHTHQEYGRRLYMFNDIDDNSLEFAYSHAAALVFSSHAEGFGLPLVEAMQRGLPAMGSDIPVFREIGGDYMAYFDLQDPQSLARLIHLYENGGSFPAKNPLEQWQWINWSSSTKQLVRNVRQAEEGNRAYSA
ncbi:glycosyltransferase family 4 protein [Pseudomonas sp. 5P_3.1_Bac2]|uniref:glycosyltransferase family 4 protein n=1 Tax=Pseudomonas sp. 5P_3.1_Bac2 TaxID=2971617 RepID=UPI0021C8D3BF|nr:glycosyltransferase family 1 protein [Pseudomonas sp. 5P_3.1_Bac2]MCU1719250.1 glycosyltransferase family 4 protein [Pseudomonas sp. 5P_3.1_Bac2]